MANPIWPDLSERYRGSEQMDNPDFSGDELRLALKHLERINRWFGNYRSVRLALEKLIPDIQEHDPLHIVDIGCGGGDLMCHLNQYFQKKNIAVRFTGIDVNPHILKKAGRRMCNDDNVEFQRADVLDKCFQVPHCDVVISSHFIYRFNQNELGEFLKRNRSRVKYGFIFSDLLRSRTSYLLFALLGRLIFPGRVTIADGLVAIRRSFRFGELQKTISRKWPEAIVQRRWFLRQIAIFHTK